jgi:NADP-dependent 3-hydroxy acid dehydrogenase YdfG
MSATAALRPGAVALVIGASSGIGEAVAEALAARGCRVICAGRRGDRLRALVRRLAGGAQALALDVTDAAATRGLLGRLPPELREIDILVNSAAHDIGGRRRFDEGRIEEWADIITTNVTGGLRACHAVIPQMLARGRGHLVNIGSNAGVEPYAGGTAYVASKFAVRGFTDALRADYADTDLRITEIQPGLTRTEFAQTRFYGDPESGARYYRQAPGTLLAADVARAVVFALEQPPHASITRIHMMPTREA